MGINTYKKSKKILFNKNNILIEEHLYEYRETAYVEEKIDQLDSTSPSIRHRYANKIEKYITKYIEEVKESPLGFYYKITKPIKQLNPKYNNESSNLLTPILYKTYYIYGKKYHYIIKYPYYYNGVNIGIETRPYDLANTNGLDDHFIVDLKNELDMIFEIAKQDNISLYTKWSYFKCNKILKDRHIGEVKADIYKDIFGFKDGPKHQTNDSKILSHGFDLKESFRKRKET